MKKSMVKMHGVKAVYHIKRGVDITAAFGKGNDSILDKRIDNGNVDDIRVNSDIELSVTSEIYSFSKKRIKNKEPGKFNVHDDYEDQLKIRSKLEEEVFGKNFNDNIHIQAAYAVNDIIKMLAVAANLAGTAINGLDRTNTDEDIIGFCIIPSITYECYGTDKRIKWEAFLGNVKAQNTMYYYPDMMITQGKDDNGKEKPLPVDDKTIYNIMCIISLIRNAATHSNNRNSDHLFGTMSSGICDAMRKTAGKLISGQIKAINNGFSQNQKNNIYRLLKAGVVTENDADKLIRELYDFVIEKQDKNLGFSLKKLRECAIASENEKLKYIKNISSINYDTVRGKLYTLIDFAVYYYLKNNNTGKEFSDDIVEQLRIAGSDEDKQTVYRNQAEKLYTKFNIKNYIINLKDNINRDFKEPERNSYDDKLITEGIKKVQKYFISTEKISDFTKFIYVLCRFLDGKNINILLSSLLSKFQQIETFNKDIKELNLDITGENKIGYNSKKYSLFEESGRIAQELEMLRGVIKMDINDLGTKKGLIKDALRVIGVREDDIEDIYTEYFNSDNRSNRVSNFFCQNIINSRRFRYIVKYINPSDAYTIIQNEKIRDFVLERIDDKVIDRYARSIGIEDTVTDKRKALADILRKISFDNFKDLKNISHKDRERGRKAKEREKPKAILGLYLTIVYLVVKNLVRINSQYVMAAYHLERDSRLSEYGTPNNYMKLTMNYCENKLLKPKHIKKLDRYIKIESGEYEAHPYQKDLYTAYRNCIAHISAVREIGKYIGDIKEFGSYFGIYHYCMQRYLCSDYFEELVKSIFKNEKELDKIESGCYSQAILRALNYPFGYNPARYKNLSYEKIFIRSWQDEDTNKKA